jgi:hypothetical protein
LPDVEIPNALFRWVDFVSGNERDYQCDPPL